MAKHNWTHEGEDYFISCLYTYVIYHALVLKFGGENMIYYFLFENFLPKLGGGCKLLYSIKNKESE
jgi:hypothetical protein